jgi:thymidylate synthase
VCPQIVAAETSLVAWQRGVNALIEANGELANLITTIDRPDYVDPLWLAQRSPHRFSNGSDDIRDVANTIFPKKLYLSYPDRQALYAEYLRRHDRARRWGRGKRVWGTYFERLIRFPDSDVNQLERVIEKLLAWTKRSTTALVFHLASPVTDAPRTRGGPCWHYAELLWNADGTLDLVAVYRNHDFFNKVLGNFIGLGRLLHFICRETNKECGRLVCHSVHAYHDGSAETLRRISS